MVECFMNLVFFLICLFLLYEVIFLKNLAVSVIGSAQGTDFIGTRAGGMAGLSGH